MVINFKARKISQDTHKLSQTSTLIKNKNNYALFLQSKDTLHEGSNATR